MFYFYQNIGIGKKYIKSCCLPLRFSAFLDTRIQRKRQPATVAEGDVLCCRGWSSITHRLSRGNLSADIHERLTFKNLFWRGYRQRRKRRGRWDWSCSSLVWMVQIEQLAYEISYSIQGFPEIKGLIAKSVSRSSIFFSCLLFTKYLIGKKIVGLIFSRSKF